MCKKTLDSIGDCCSPDNSFASSGAGWRADDSATTAGSSSFPMGHDPSFQMQPPRRKMYLTSLACGPRPAPADWKKRLEMAVAALPVDATIDQLVEAVADIAPDRGRALIQVIEDELDVMEDAMNDIAEERLRHHKAQQKAEMRALTDATRASQEASISAQQRLYQLVPLFDWDRYYSQPHYLRSVLIVQDDAVDQQCITEAITHCKDMKRLLRKFIDQVNERRFKMDRDVKCGVLMSVNEEIARVQKENTACRNLYNYVRNIWDQMSAKRGRL